MARNDWNYTTICPLAYTNIEVHYGDQYFPTTFCRLDDNWNVISCWTAALYNNTPQNVNSWIVWWYEFCCWEFTDHNGCCQTPTDNPVSLLTDQQE